MEIKISDFTISSSSRTFIIAELSANHGHDLNLAKKTIFAAKKSGADAIKIQTYTADTLTIDCDNEYFILDSGTIWDGITLYNLYKQAYTPWEWQKELKIYAESIGLIFFSTPFDKTAVDFLELINVPAYKIASFEIMDLPLVEYIASKGKPVIISTGVATLKDIYNAVNICKSAGNMDIILLKCTSSYPAKAEDANLITIPNMKETFKVQVGLSDHTIGITVPVVSIALGAKVIEKHFILDKNIGGPDASFSLEPKEFSEMVKAVREAEKSIGIIDYDMNKSKKKNRVFGRSLFVVENVEKGEEFTEKNVRSIRPSYGLPPKHIGSVLGKNAKIKLKKGTPLKWEYLS